MKRKNPFVFRLPAPPDAEAPPVEYPTRIDEEGRTVTMLPPRYAENDEPRYTARAKKKPKRE